MRTLIPICLASLLSLSLSAAALEPTAHQQLRAELAVTGDDGLTNRFAEQLKSALIASPEFIYPSDESYDIRLYLAGNLYWSETEQGTNFNVVVVFTDSKENFLGISTGACWEVEMKSCAEQVVSEAVVHAKKIHATNAGN